jgi:hypothetical protein
MISGSVVAGRCRSVSNSITFDPIHPAFENMCASQNDRFTCTSGAADERDDSGGLQFVDEIRLLMTSHMCRLLVNALPNDAVGSIVQRGKTCLCRSSRNSESSAKPRLMFSMTIIDKLIGTYETVLCFFFFVTMYPFVTHFQS